MALTQISTNGIKDLNVNTDDIANNAVTMAKLDNTGGITLPANIGVVAANMYPNAIVTATLANNAVNADKIINGAINTAKLADQSVTLDKFVHGTSSNNGKFLRANNGADPTFETVNTDLVSDTSPQLGGTLDVNGNVIQNGFGSNLILQLVNGEKYFQGIPNGASEIFYDGNAKLATTNTGVSVTGTVAATSFTGDGSSLTGVASTVAGGAIYENSQTISTTHTIPVGSNGMSAGPVTINDGISLTISNGSTYTIV